MNEATTLFLAVFLCGLVLKSGEAVGELIFYIVKQSYAIHKAKKELKRLQARNKHSGGVEQ